MWEAAQACLRGGFAGVELDVASGLAMASALGCPAPVAAPLLAAFGTGVEAARAKIADRTPPDAADDPREP